MSYIYAISDIHGRYDLLADIIENNVDFSDSCTKLICCGDYIDGRNGNSYMTLKYLYELQMMHPEQVVVLTGNHDRWLSDWLQNTDSLFSLKYYPEISTIQDFLSNDEFRNTYIETRRKSINNIELTSLIYQKCHEIINKNHKQLVKWLKNLPYFYESDYNQILVHAGLCEIEGENELWKVFSDEEDYLMKFPASRDKFYKDVIAGHIGTNQITDDSSFHDICRYGSHIYLDSTVDVSERLNLLKYNTENGIYTGISKNEEGLWHEYEIKDRRKGK